MQLNAVPFDCDLCEWVRESVQPFSVDLVYYGAVEELCWGFRVSPCSFGDGGGEGEGEGSNRVFEPGVDRSLMGEYWV